MIIGSGDNELDLGDASGSDDLMDLRDADASDDSDALAHDQSLDLRDAYDMQHWTCTCTYATLMSASTAHDDDCELWKSWDFEAGYAEFDDNTWALVPVGKEWADHNQAAWDLQECTCRRCLDAMWSQVMDSDEELDEQASPWRSSGAYGADEQTIVDAREDAPTGPKNYDSRLGPCDCEYFDECKCPGGLLTDKESCGRCWGTGGVKMEIKARPKVYPAGATTWGKCRHYQQAVTLPGGEVVYCSSHHHDRSVNKTQVPDLGVYLDGSWKPDCLAYHVGCPDYGVPRPEPEDVLFVAKVALRKARAGQLVEIGCIGGHGRTGTFLALLCLLSAHEAKLELSGGQAQQWVWDHYCKEAIESKRQQWYIDGMGAELKGEAWPPWVEPPKPPPAKQLPCQETGCDSTYSETIDTKFCWKHRPSTSSSSSWGTVYFICKWGSCKIQFPAQGTHVYCSQHRQEQAA